jgi:nucleoside-diphosphate-sugar epimerase
MPVQGQKFVIIGGAGRLGGALAHRLIDGGVHDVIICDSFGDIARGKWANVPIAVDDIWTPANLLTNLDKAWREIAGIILAVHSEPEDQDVDALFEAAFQVPRRVWDFCVAKQRPIYWASSWHIYGRGPAQVSSSPADMATLKPITAFGRAKLAFDMFAARQGTGSHAPPIWAGYRLFDVYGGLENPEGDCASLPVRAMAAAKLGGQLSLNAEDQVGRDWVHVDDAATAITGLVLGEHQGFFDIGTGVLTETSELTRLVERTVGKPLKRACDVGKSDSFQSMPAACLAPLRDAGVSLQFRSLEQGLADL